MLELASALFLTLVAANPGDETPALSPYAQDIASLATLEPQQVPLEVKSRLERLGLRAIWSASEQTLIAKQEVQDPSAIRLLLVAHMDYKVPESSLIKVYQSPSMGETIQGPGVHDNLGGVVSLIELIKLLKSTDLWPRIDLRVFVSNDGQEWRSKSRASEEALLNFAQKPLDMALVFEPGINSGTASKDHGIILPSALLGSYELHLRVEQAEGSESRNVIDGLMMVLRYFKDWNREGRHIVPESVDSPASSHSATASFTFEFRDDAATFQDELAGKRDELQAHLHRSGFRVIAVKDELRWSPSPILTPDQMKFLTRAGEDAGIPRLEFHDTSHRGTDVILQRKGISAVGGLGLIGSSAKGKKPEYASVTSMQQRLRLCVQIVQNLSSAKLTP